MTCTVRHTDIVNGTGALIPSFSPLIMINGGNDRSLEVINRTIITAEIGNGAGKTLDNTGPAAGQPEGLLFAQFQGACIQSVITANLKKTFASTHNNFSAFAWATVTPHISNLRFMVINSMQGNGLIVSSLYLLDGGDNAATQIANGDRVEVLLEVGNIPAAVSGATLP
jgi:hypothetical protein